MVDNDSDGHHFYDDIFPDEPSQFADVDGDGFGDNSSGFEGDACPNVAGNSTLDYYGCLDNDGDGYSYLTDSFRTDPTQWNDTDGDGFGDRLNGNRGDSCPSVAGSSYNNNTFGCPDSDFDGWADTDDAFRFESSQWNDSDGDGYGDNISGLNGDEFKTFAGNCYISDCG